MNIPQEITSGDSMSWLDQGTTDNLGNSISPEAWTLTYAIRGASNLTLTATLYQGQWKTSITSVQSLALAAGTYYWQAFVTSGAERKTLGAGQVKILANLNAISTAGHDGRSQNRKDLEAVQAAVRAMISGGAVQSYTIGNRTLSKMSVTDLLLLESRLKRAVALEEKEEKIRAGLGNPNNLFVRF